MKLANIEVNGYARVTLVLDDELIDLTSELGAGAADLTAFLSMGAEARALADRCRKTAPRLTLSDVKLQAPVLRPDKILGVGMNYHSFVAAVQRIGVPLPTNNRIWFSRPSACIVGPYDDVWLPRDAHDLDYEVELAIVIGRRCRYVSLNDAPAVIAGFTVANDLTLRERVLKSLVFGKSFDTHTPLGPWVVTADELGDPHRLGLKTWVNGELRQQSDTADMIASCYELIAEISAVCTLNPGDIILTGTPDGSGIFQSPPKALAAGDVVKLEIERIGAIENRVVDEPAFGGGT